MIFNDYMHGIIGAESVFNSSLWTLHDNKIYNILDRLVSAWKETLAYGRRYQTSVNGGYYVFSNNYAYESSEEVRADEKAISLAARNLYDAKEELLERLRSHCPEIDIKETSRKAHEDFISYST